jgi:hypothetical protein
MSARMPEVSFRIVHVPKEYLEPRRPSRLRRKTKYDMTGLVDSLYSLVQQTTPRLLHLEIERQVVRFGLMLTDRISPD